MIVGISKWQVFLVSLNENALGNLPHRLHLLFEVLGKHVHVFSRSRLHALYLTHLSSGKSPSVSAYKMHSVPTGRISNSQTLRHPFFNVNYQAFEVLLACILLGLFFPRVPHLRPSFLMPDLFGFSRFPSCPCCPCKANFSCIGCSPS